MHCEPISPPMTTGAGLRSPHPAKRRVASQSSLPTTRTAPQRSATETVTDQSLPVNSTRISRRTARTRLQVGTNLTESSSQVFRCQRELSVEAKLAAFVRRWAKSAKMRQSRRLLASARVERRMGAWKPER